MSSKQVFPLTEEAMKALVLLYPKLTAEHLAVALSVPVSTIEAWRAPAALGASERLETVDVLLGQGFTQAQIARVLGLRQSTVSRYVNQHFTCVWLRKEVVRK